VRFFRARIFLTIIIINSHGGEPRGQFARRWGWRRGTDGADGAPGDRKRLDEREIRSRDLAASVRPGGLHAATDRAHGREHQEVRQERSASVSPPDGARSDQIHHQQLPASTLREDRTIYDSYPVGGDK